MHPRNPAKSRAPALDLQGFIFAVNAKIIAAAPFMFSF
jgi:hypothetical protein